MIRSACLFVAVLAASGAAALDLPTGARMVAERLSPADRYHTPIGRFFEDHIPMLAIDGAVKRQAWQIPGEALTPMQLLAPLRAQLEAQGFQQLFDCVAERCGGFDFRFGVEILPAPAMFVNLHNFRFATFVAGPSDAPDAVVTLLASASRDASYIQVIEVQRAGEFEATPVVPEKETDPAPDMPKLDLGPDALLKVGFMALEGLEFESGSSRLGAGPFVALQELAAFMTDNPGLRIALVGHTDTVGALDKNIRISRARARSVRKRLIETHGIAAHRMDAQGMGYLAPRASNLTESGREANRRVEAILISVDQ